MESMVGTWHRVCNVQNLGSFAHLSDSKSYVVVEPVEGSPFSWSWRFGNSLDCLRVGYTTTLGAAPFSVSSSLQLKSLHVTCGVGSGSGALRSDGVITLTLLQASGLLATVVYRMLDPDTVAVSVVEVPEKGETATCSTGFMFRVPQT
jgi:hypothetical protein